MPPRTRRHCTCTRCASVGDELYIAGEQGLLLKLDRASGQFRALELPYKGTLFGVTGNDRAVIVHGLRGTVLRSTDAGRSWQTVNTGLQVGLTASSIDAQGRIVIVSQAGHVLRQPRRRRQLRAGQDRQDQRRPRPWPSSARPAWWSAARAACRR